ncbi:MAG: serine/threonine-protein kinase [Myxococcota bacterium]
MARADSEPPDRAARAAVLGPAAAGVITFPQELEPAQFGRYEVVASIGRGGMGEVYLARRRGKTGKKLVALKVLVAEEGADDDLVSMFIDEASIMAQIHHPNVLEVFDFGREGGRYFLAMEYLSGRPLVRLMIDAYGKQSGLSAEVVAEIGAQAARGLDAAHGATGKSGQPLQVVHRDVSPQNLFVTYAGQAKVLDFGVARAAERLSQTTAGQLKGKAAYMSPEQVQGQMVDRRSDVFSLGICLWEMSAGRRLFKRDNEWDTMTAVVSGPIVPPSQVRGSGDPELDRTILKALERDADRRFANAAELAARLEAMVKTKPNASQKIAEVMARLYGEEARQEASLVHQLEQRTANPAEMDTLRKLSGISPHPAASMREITIAGAPEGLVELDRFGMDDTDPVGPKVREFSDSATPTTGPAVVQRAAERLKREQVDARNQRRAEAIGIPQTRRGRVMLAAGIVGASTLVTVLTFVILKLIAPSPESVADLPTTPPTVIEVEPIALDPVDVEIPKSVEGVLPELRKNGMSAAIDDGRAIVSGANGSTEVALDADLVAVHAGDLRGYLFSSRKTGLAAISFAGGSSEGGWSARPMSVNDCPAQARPQDAALELMYGAQRVVVGYQTELSAVTSPRPAWAERAEVEPLHLAFGALMPDRSGVLCPSGLDAKELRLTRIPPGKYTLTWLGAGRSEARDLTVAAPTGDTVPGADPSK